jgi:hypothetical protein
MKNFRFIFSIIILLFSISKGQSAFSSQNASATAYLVVPISIKSTLGDLDFGEIILTGSSSQEVLAPRNGKLFVVSGHPGRNVTFTYSPVTMDNTSWVLTSGGNVDKLEFIPDVELANGTKINSGDAARLILNNGLGELDVWVGGSIKISANQEPGDYTGRFTLNVSY